MGGGGRCGKIISRGRRRGKNMAKQVILERDEIAKFSYVYGVSNCSLFYL